MDDLRLDNLIDETLKTIDPVEIPEDLHFDAAKIMRLARMEEEAEAEAKREERPAPLLSLSRLRDVFQSRSWTRYAAAAAAFAILLGVYGFSHNGEGDPAVPVPGGPTNVADVEIDDGQIPLAEPDDPMQGEEDPAVTPGTEVDPQPETDPQPAVTPAPPVQSAENTPAPVQPQPAPAPAEPETPPEVIDDQETPAAEGPEYAGGLEENPAEGETPQPDPAVDPENPQEDILGSLLELAMQNESFAESFAAEDKGYGYQLLKAEDVPDGTQFMVYFYESEEEAAAQTVNEENVRSILWKRESL